MKRSRTVCTRASGINLFDKPRKMIRGESRSHRLLSLINILLNKLNILICVINDDDQGNPVISTPRIRVTSIDECDTGAIYASTFPQRFLTMI